MSPVFRQRRLVQLSVVLMIMSCAAALSRSKEDNRAKQDGRRTRIASSGKTPPDSNNQAGRLLRRSGEFGRRVQGGSTGDSAAPGTMAPNGQSNVPSVVRGAHEYRMQRGTAFDGDVRMLPQTAPKVRQRPEREPPPVTPVPLPTGAATTTPTTTTGTESSSSLAPSAPAPSPL